MGKIDLSKEFKERYTATGKAKIVNMPKLNKLRVEKAGDGRGVQILQMGPYGKAAEVTRSLKIRWGERA